MISQNIRGSLFAIISGFLYGFLGFFGISAIKNDLSITNMLFWRFCIASLALCIFLIPQMKKIRFSSRPIFQAFFNGAIFYGLSTMLYFYACQYISTGLSMVIFFTYPLMVMFLNILFFQQSISKICYISMFFIMTGMVFVVDLKAKQFNITGILLGIFSGFFYACYIVSSKRTLLSPAVSTFAVSLGCTLTFFLMSLANQSLNFPTGSIIWLNLIGIGIIATAIPVLLLLYSLKLIGSAKASILSVLEPVFVVIFGILLLDELLKPSHIFGIAFILGGALLTLFGESQSLGSKKSV